MMKILLLDVSILLLAFLVFSFLTKKTHDGESIFAIWFYGTLFVLPIPLTIVNSICYPKWYGYEHYYLAFLPIISTVLCIIVPKVQDMLSVYRFKKHKKPVHSFANEVIQKYGLGQENTGKVMQDTIKKGYGAIYGKLFIELVKEEETLLQEKKEAILKEFSQVYPHVDLHMYSNRFISVERIREERKRAASHT